MRNSIKIASATIVDIVEERFMLVDDERDELENKIQDVLDELFPTDTQVVDGRQQTISFTPAFNVSTNSTSSNSTPKENDLDRRKEETRYNSRNPKGRTEYTPRRDGNVRDKSK